MIISIHALLAESDASHLSKFDTSQNFYPRSPCGERPQAIYPSSTPPKISIHALLAESDSVSEWTAIWTLSFLSTLSLRRATSIRIASNFQSTFLSTLSLRRATVKLFRQNYECFISIHALLAESDTLGCSRDAHSRDFYPRSPCGERHAPSQHPCLSNKNFYPRSPCGERQARLDSRQQPAGISIHALLAESDIWVLQS